MRTGLLSSGVFWGVFLIVWGVLALLKAVFNLNIPVFRTVVALFFISLGVSVLLGGFGVRTDRNTVLFEEKKLVVGEASQDYHVVFGRGFLDLSGLSPEGNPSVEVAAVFGQAVVKINPETPVRVRMSAVFGHGRLPDGDVMSFGERTYRSRGFKEGTEYIDLKASAVFGSVKVVTE